MEWWRRMRVLLDTHTFLWAVLGSDRLSPKADKAIRNFHNEVFVSAATGWELTTKYRLGKLNEAEYLVRDIPGTLKRMSFQELPISMNHAARSGLLTGDHKDPFDRMLIAQSLAEGLSLVSNEKMFDAFHVHRIW